MGSTAMRTGSSRSTWTDTCVATAFGRAVSLTSACWVQPDSPLLPVPAERLPRPLCAATMAMRGAASAVGAPMVTVFATTPARHGRVAAPFRGCAGTALSTLREPTMAMHHGHAAPRMAMVIASASCMQLS